MFGKFSMRRKSRAAGMLANLSASFVAAAIILLAAPLHADSFNWVVSLGDWSNAGNWLDLSNSGEIMPTSSDTAYIVNGGTAVITMPGAVCHSVYVGDPGSTNSGMIQMSAGNLTADGEYLGNYGECTFTQSGGTNNGSLYLGNNLGSGSYRLFSQGRLSGGTECVGCNGSGTFAQSDGTNNVSSVLYLGYNAGSTGSYNLSGGYSYFVPARLWGGTECVGYSGTGMFTQSGWTINTCSGLYVGYNAGSTGSYNLSGQGQGLSSGTECIGYSGTGTLTQPGGYNSITSNFYLGFNAGSGGSYSLSGSGQISAGTECVGYSGSGTFNQSAGCNSVNYLSIGALGRYQFSGGTLQVTGAGLNNQGTFDATGSTGMVTVTCNAIVDFSQATLINTGSMSLSNGSNSLLLLPAGFDPAHALRRYSNLGMVHNVGAPLTILSGQGFAGSGSVADFVNCQGTISATKSGSINLNGGVSVSGAGNVSLGNGGFYANDALSGISGGLLSAGSEYVGYTVAGTFTQSGGTNSANLLYLGRQAGSSGTYILSGDGQLSGIEFVGGHGTGSFIQTDGTNFGSPLIIGGNGGTYNLSGNGLIDALEEDVGSYGTGSFTQSGGTNLQWDNYGVYIGYHAGDNGTYSLSGSGRLSAQVEYIGYSGTGAFTQSGGNHRATAMYLGYNQGSNGTYNLDGGSLLGTVALGYSGTGSFNQAGGTNSGNLVLGYNAGSSGTYTLSGSGLLSGTESIGNFGSGNFTQTGGTNSGGLVLGCYAGSSGTYNLNGGMLILPSLRKGLGSAEFNFNGGTLSASSGFSTSLDSHSVAFA